MLSTAAGVGRGGGAGSCLPTSFCSFFRLRFNISTFFPSTVDAPVAGAELGISSNSQSIPAHCHSPSPEIPSMQAGGLQDASSDGQCCCWVLIYT